MSSRAGEIGLVWLVLGVLVLKRIERLRAMIPQPLPPNPPSSPQPAPNNPPHGNAPGWPGGAL